MVSIGSQYHHDHPTGDARALASCRFPPVLALEVPLPWRSAAGARRGDCTPILGDRHQGNDASVQEIDLFDFITGQVQELALADGDDLQMGLEQRIIPRPRRLRTMGIRDRPISPRSPWQNAYVERVIGTLRRECLDHVLVFGEWHLWRILTLYSRYYNQTRTHLGLGKAAPLGRHIERSGTIVTTPILSGLHHCYARI
jgi:Integrase core domain